jgi:hypothetical protein
MDHVIIILFFVTPGSINYIYIYMHYHYKKTSQITIEAF